MLNTITSVLNDDQGQGLAEYALILFLVSIAAYAALQTLGGNISALLTRVAGDV